MMVLEKCQTGSFFVSFNIYNLDWAIYVYSFVIPLSMNPFMLLLVLAMFQ